MNEYDIRRLALILAIQAEIKGMEFENLQREQSNESHAYTFEDFNSKAEELRELAYRPKELL